MKGKRRDYDTVEMQMGPMIDMVFLLLVFFMVTAKPIKKEADISLSLPGKVEQTESVEMPDEQSIVIDEKSQVILNDMKYDEPGSRDLPNLVKTLKRFRQSSENNKNKALVTLAPDDKVPHQMIVNVLNACAEAGVKGVSFSYNDEEEDE